MSTGNGHFNLLARVLHWSMALMIIAMLFIGVTMVASLHLRPMLIDLHRPLGIAILLLQLNSNNLGAGTGFTLSQLGILISTPLGILWLHETRSRKELRWTGIGVFLVIAGAVLAGIAKSLDAA